jgi:hypothetical protein
VNLDVHFKYKCILSTNCGKWNEIYLLPFFYFGSSKIILKYGLLLPVGSPLFRARLHTVIESMVYTPFEHNLQIQTECTNNYCELAHSWCILDNLLH